MCGRASRSYPTFCTFAWIGCKLLNINPGPHVRLYALRRHQPDGAAELGELARPEMRARLRFHPDPARR
jgi:hypothetical protein